MLLFQRAGVHCCANARSDSYAVVIGRRDFSDAQNSIKIDHLIVNNASAGSQAGGLQLNYVPEFRDLCSGGFGLVAAAGIALEQTQISRLSGAGSASARGGAALTDPEKLATVVANTIDATVDLEVAPTCLVIDSRNFFARSTTSISPYMACSMAGRSQAAGTPPAFW